MVTARKIWCPTRRTPHLWRFQIQWWGEEDCCTLKTCSVTVLRIVNDKPATDSRCFDTINWACLAGPAGRVAYITFPVGSPSFLLPCVVSSRIANGPIDTIVSTRSQVKLHWCWLQVGEPCVKSGGNGSNIATKWILEEKGLWHSPVTYSGTQAPTATCSSCTCALLGSSLNVSGNNRLLSKIHVIRFTWI